MLQRCRSRNLTEENLKKPFLGPKVADPSAPPRGCAPGPEVKVQSRCPPEFWTTSPDWMNAAVREAIPHLQNRRQKGTSLIVTWLGRRLRLGGRRRLLPELRGGLKGRRC